jgi:nicotinate phosphoribosyltransferase
VISKVELAASHSRSSFRDSQNLRRKDDAEGPGEDFLKTCLDWRHKISKLLGILEEEASNGEFAAFISYAIAFPSNFLALIDTYDVTR